MVEISEGYGGCPREEFSRVLKDANRTRHTYVNYFDL